MKGTPHDQPQIEPGLALDNLRMRLRAAIEARTTSQQTELLHKALEDVDAFDSAYKRSKVRPKTSKFTYYVYSASLGYSAGGFLMLSNPGSIFLPTIVGIVVAAFGVFLLPKLEA